MDVALKTSLNVNLDVTFCFGMAFDEHTEKGHKRMVDELEDANYQ